MDKIGLGRYSSPRQGSGLPPLGGDSFNNHHSSQQLYHDDDDDEEEIVDHGVTRQAERRRRRFRKQKMLSGGITTTTTGGIHSDPNNNMGGNSETTTGDSTSGAKNNSGSAEKKKKNKRKEKKSSSSHLPDEEYDPYDSDPGESYRAHCLRVNGMSTKSCLKLPTFLKQGGPGSLLSSSRGGGGGGGLLGGESETQMTSPPSPMTSELGDVLSQTPASLPTDLTRVRYSLRSSITDGAEKQPSGPSVMERRELRPNNVHINVSHWSDAGARQYMEDRYVSSTCWNNYGICTRCLE